MIELNIQQAGSAVEFHAHYGKYKWGTQRIWFLTLHYRIIYKSSFIIRLSIKMLQPKEEMIELNAAPLNHPFHKLIVGCIDLHVISNSAKIPFWLEWDITLIGRGGGKITIMSSLYSLECALLFACLNLTALTKFWKIMS